MIPLLSFVHFACITIENTTPLSIGVGRGDGLQDALVVLDANGLPALPGSSLAGVLRHLYTDSFSQKDSDRLFGTIKDKAQASRLDIGWGHIHSSDDIPVYGLSGESVIQKDEILKKLLEDPLPIRDGVKINGRGVAEETGKFDRSYLPPGYRFSFDLSLWNEEASSDWDQLLKLLSSPFFRLGGLTHRGFGAFKIVRMMGQNFNLRIYEDLQSFGSISRSFRKDLIPIHVSHSSDNHHEITISLKPEAGGFLFGGGSVPMGPSSKKAADTVPVSEMRVKWKDNKGSLSERRDIVIPASSVKGAFAHRVAFHYNRLTNKFGNEASDTKDNVAVHELFGMALNGENPSRPGRVWFDDVYVPVPEDKLKRQIHNSIDRFTGGVINGALYSEEIVHDPSELTIICRIANKEYSAHVLDSFYLTLEDLTKGRMALGAGGSKGHGYFHGEHDWKKTLSKGERVV